MFVPHEVNMVAAIVAQSVLIGAVPEYFAKSLSVEFVVALPPDQMTTVYALFEEICERFDQKCLYFTIGGDAALYHPTKERDRETGPGPA